MKILLITFDKEMEKKIKNILKDYEIITAKNGEEALLLDIAKNVDIVIYDALAGGIAEDDINRLYENGFQNTPFIILMDDLFPIDPNNIKPELKKIISREVDLNQLPKLVKELAKEKGVSPKPSKAETPAEKKEELSWEALTPTEGEQEEEKVSTAVESAEETPSGEYQTFLKKQCLLVSFDIPLVERIKQLIGDKCDLYIAKSAKQALQKYAGRPFDIIIFDTISGVFAEKGIKDLYEQGGYKDSLYVLLLDEFLPIDVDKLPVKNLTSIRREAEIDLLPEIVEDAPHITLGMVATPSKTEEEHTPTEETTPTAEAVEHREEVPVESVPQSVEVQGETVPHEEVTKEETIPSSVAAEETVFHHEVEQPKQPAVVQPSVEISEETIERIIEQKINEKVLPLIEELVRSKLTETYIKAIAREIIEPEIDEALIKEIVQEIAEPLVREVIDQMLT